MNFSLTEEQQALQETARKYAQERLPAHAKHCEEHDEPPSHELVREFAEMGFLGINVSSEYGGLGLGNLEALIVIEELAKVRRGLPGFRVLRGPGARHRAFRR